MTEENRGTYPERRLSRRRRPAKIDNFLIKLTAGFVAVLLLSQCFLLSSRTRQFFSMVDRMEGDQISFSIDLYAGYEAPSNAGENSALSRMSKMVGSSLSAIRQGQNLVIRMIEPQESKNVFVLINGKPFAHFGGGRVEVVVYDGDYVEIDSTRLKEPASFTVNTTGRSKVVSPPDGMLLKGGGTILTVGKVRFK